MKEITAIPQPGERSQNVMAMQEALNIKSSAGLKVDGDFGAKTRAAVSVFQKSLGLPGTGVPGEKTIKALDLEIAKLFPPTTGADPDEGTPPWYRRMFVKCTVDITKESVMKAAQNTIDRGLLQYLNLAKGVGIQGSEKQLFFAYIFGVLHYKEASCDFNRVLHNGERIIGTGKKTVLVPAGRGPFDTWLEAGIDAITLNGTRWSKLLSGSTDIGEVLYAMERFNGPGYITGAGKLETSPYLWSCSNINDGKGIYISDGKFNPEASSDGSVGAALLLRAFYEEGSFKCTGVESKPVIPLPDLAPPLVPGNVVRREIADKIISIVKRDVDAELRETHGFNRSPRIDSFNLRTGVAMGSPYCASGLWCAIDDACKAMGLKNPAKPTASSQDFRRDTYIPAKYLKSDGSIGKAGDVVVLQVPGDSYHGHLALVSEDQSEVKTFKTLEYNTDAVSGDRDGDGAYAMVRTTEDRSPVNAGKIFVCFADVAQWIFDANNVQS